MTSPLIQLFRKQPQVFTPHMCKVLAEANQIIRTLRVRGVKALRIKLDGVCYGLPAELVIDQNTTRIDSNTVHITHF